jgi:hypothetical protein
MSTEPDKDGIDRGFHLTAEHPSIQVLESLFKGLEANEHQIILALQKAMRKHPLGEWQRQATGVGEKQLARLLGTIGDPYLRESFTEEGVHEITPRTVSQLWAYCGMHVVDGASPKRKKGEQLNFKIDARMRCYLIATSCIKQSDSPYRKIYDDRRAHTLVTHPDWTLGHSHNDALRLIGKAILKDLWVASREYHNN